MQGVKVRRLLFVFALIVMLAWGPHSFATVSVADYASIQDALNANPGERVYFPAGTHTVDRAIHIVTNGGGLYGPGRILQTNPQSTNVTNENAADVFVADAGVVNDPAAAPLWARLYEIDTGRPFCCNRDGTKVYALHEVALERRTGYAWYGTWPAKLLREHRRRLPQVAP